MSCIKYSAQLSGASLCHEAYLGTGEQRLIFVAMLCGVLSQQWLKREIFFARLGMSWSVLHILHGNNAGDVIVLVQNDVRINRALVQDHSHLLKPGSEGS